MFLGVPLDDSFDLFPETEGRYPRVVVGDNLACVAVYDELREVPGYLLDHVVLRIV